MILIWNFQHHLIVTNLHQGIYETHKISSPFNIEIFSYANLSPLKSIHNFFFFFNYSIKQIIEIFTNQTDHISPTNITIQQSLLAPDVYISMTPLPRQIQNHFMQILTWVSGRVFVLKVPSSLALTITGKLIKVSPPPYSLLHRTRIVTYSSISSILGQISYNSHKNWILS